MVRPDPAGGRYSVDLNRERFAPLHQVADALIAYLAATYDVSVSDGDAGVGVVRAVLVEPNAPDAASLKFVFTDYPGIRLRTGLLRDFPAPQCGCEACDETWSDCADNLEQHVLAVCEGRYRESLSGGWVEYEFVDPDGVPVESGRGQADAHRAVELATARSRLEALPGGRWAPWPTAGPEPLPP
jgi:hypothetical protein